MFPEEYQTYVNGLAQVLRTRDPAQVREFYLQWKERMELPPLPENDVLEAQMHQMICEFPSLSDLHSESRSWLLAHGFAAPVESADDSPETAA
ncbi:MAG: hypothetical protein L0196_10140 [candidate division Zixibacteria bacterium]|nr:hypothetical protein [candidate division Zixibacteria bacterium]